MKNKLKFLIKQSLERKTKTKWFLVANIALAVLIIGIINIDSVIKFSEEISTLKLIYM